jgi:processive 1,2-diacylglycerol beta-glucosyltransferase
MKKILIFYASYGGGHLSAAKSIKECIEKNYTNIEIEIIDCMRYINKVVNKVTTGAYNEMAKDIPKLWGKVYAGSQKGLLSSVSKESNKLMARKLFKLIIEYKPDLIISTHPFSTQMVSYLKKKGHLNCELATILTDFSMHTQWLIGNEYGNYFFVANSKMEEQLINYGVDSKKIHVTGIPLSSKFKRKIDNNETFKLFDLKSEKRTILFFGGGEFGLGKERTVQILDSLIRNVPDYQIVAIAGKNEKMKKKFEKVVEKENAINRVRVLGFTDKVPELMKIAEIVVTKPGGLTTSESLASGLPMLVISPIPGQEEENAQFLEEKGVGIWLKKEQEPDEVIKELFNNEEKIKKMKERVKLFAKKDSTESICKILLGEEYKK